MKKLLVVAPRFPAINQPWMDTYFEQLLKNHIDFCIYTENRGATVYGEKVDRLSLLNKVLEHSESRGRLCKTLMRKLVENPASVGRTLLTIWRLILSTYPSWRLRLGSAKRLFHFLYAENFPRDIGLVHVHSEVYAYEFLPLALIYDVPIILTFHGLPPSGIGQLGSIKRMVLYRNLDLVLVNTQFAMRQVSSLGCDVEKILIIPQGLPISDFPYQPKPMPQREGKLNIISVGRFHRDKGQGYALVAAARLSKMGANFFWTFVGVGPDLARLNRLTEKLGLTGNVRFMQGISSGELLGLYQDSNIFVLCSTDSGRGDHVETQGVVLQEAQAVGCIPIASKVGGIPECIIDQENGFLIPQKNSRAIAHVVTELINNPELCLRVQSAGRKWVETNFSADVIGKKMAGIIGQNITP